MGYRLLDILSEPKASSERASSEIKGNPHLLKQLLILSKIFVTELAEAAGLLKVLKEVIDLLAQLVVAFTEANSPLFGLKRFKDCFRRILMAFQRICFGRSDSLYCCPS